MNYVSLASIIGPSRRPHTLRCKPSGDHGMVNHNWVPSPFTCVSECWPGADFVPPECVVSWASGLVGGYLTFATVCTRYVGNSAIFITLLPLTLPLTRLSTAISRLVIHEVDLRSSYDYRKLNKMGFVGVSTQEELLKTQNHHVLIVQNELILFFDFLLRVASRKAQMTACTPGSTKTHQPALDSVRY